MVPWLSERRAEVSASVQQLSVSGVLSPQFPGTAPSPCPGDDKCEHLKSSRQQGEVGGDRGSEQAAVRLLKVTVIFQAL